MGCGFSCKRLPFSSKPPKFKTIRVVHLNGYVEEFESPVGVAEVIGEPPKHFLFTRAQVQLLAAGSTPLDSDALLEPGQAYFLLPHSLFDATVSPLDLAPIARKLVSMSRSKSGKQNVLSGGSGKSPVWRSPTQRPEKLYSDRSGSQMGGNQEFSRMQKSPKLRSWKPILATIQEMSSNLRCGSDLPADVIVDCTKKLV